MGPPFKTWVMLSLLVVLVWPVEMKLHPQLLVSGWHDRNSIPRVFFPEYGRFKQYCLE